MLCLGSVVQPAILKCLPMPSAMILLLNILPVTDTTYRLYCFCAAGTATRVATPVVDVVNTPQGTVVSNIPFVGTIVAPGGRHRKMLRLNSASTTTSI
jgi:hypothetical protein